MAQSTLVNVYLEDGWKLVSRLKTSDIPIEAAYWSYYGLYERWELYIVTSLVEKSGPKGAYDKVKPVFDKVKDLEVLSFTDLHLIPPEDTNYSDMKEIHSRHAATYVDKETRRRFFMYDSAGYLLYWYNLNRAAE